MRAWIFSKYGGPDGLIFGNLPRPEPEANEALIKVEAASLNSWDWELLRGVPFANRAVFGLFRPKRINVLGCDVAGIVEATGKDVTTLKPGDAVYGDLSGGRWGGFAEYTCGREDQLVLKPAQMSFVDAAAMPQAGVLALQGLRDVGMVKAGQRVLLNGAGGGVGTQGLQLAKHWGAQVTCVDHGDKLQLLEHLGADRVIDYTQEDFTSAPEAYDVVLDVVTNRPASHYRRVLSPGGCLVMVGGEVPRMTRLALWNLVSSGVTHKRLALLLHKPNPKDLEELSRLYVAGRLKPVIGARYPIEDVPEALASLGGGKALGKLVITMD
jgi:NADPH:quinone reductase-like Zn-dependent oxidoreductase